MTKTPTKTNTMTKTMTKTFRTHLHRAILETFYLWDIWSEWCGNMTWPKKRQQQRQWQWRIHLENTNKEGSFKTFREHPQMPILKKFWVWPFIHCYEFRPLRTKLMGVGQIIHVRPNITSSAKFHNFSKISQYQPIITISVMFHNISQISQHCSRWPSVLRCWQIFLTVLYETQMFQVDTGWSRMVQDGTRWFLDVPRCSFMFLYVPRCS